MSKDDSDAQDMSSGSDDAIPDISNSMNVFLKVERILMAFSYCVMLVLACSNVWKYLIVKRMYKSYPMTAAYTTLVLFSAFKIYCELYMAIGCGHHDCIYVVSSKIKCDEDFENLWRIWRIDLELWRIGCQFQWSLGMLQSTTVFVLFLRIRSISRRNVR